MAHCIESHDIVYSNRSAEWHGLAQVTEINKSSIGKILFPIVSSEDVFADSELGQIKFSGLKALFADLRERGEGLLPLDIRSSLYRPIGNLEVWDALESGLTGIGHTITTAGTLGDCRRFFVSVELTDDKNDGFRVAGDDFKAYLNFVTSHDGTLALQAYDSNTRVVCQNTLNLSLRTAGNYRVTVKHTKNASLEIQGLEQWIQHTLRVRHEFAVSLEKLTEIKLDAGQARQAASGYYLLAQGGEGEFSPRTKKDVSNVVNLFQNGRGNKGETAYDLFNGVTDYYTNGRGAGIETASAEKRLGASFFGAAARHKSTFTELVTRDGGIDQMLDAGKKALVLLS